MSNRIITALAATVLAIPAVAAPAGYFQVPGTETTMKVYGKAETWAQYGFDGLNDVTSTSGHDQSWHRKGTTDSFVLARLGVTSTTPSSFGDVNVKLEYQAKSTGSTNAAGLNLRHAYGEFAGLLVGQTDSLFSNWHNSPNYYDSFLADFNGPGRTRQIRYTFAPAAGMKFGVSLEQDNAGSNSVQMAPAIVAAFNFGADWGGVTASVGYQKKSDWTATGFGTPANSTSTATGTGTSFAVSGAFNLGENDTLTAMVNIGGGFHGQGLADGFYAAGSGYNFYKAQVANLSYSHTWSPALQTNLGIGQTNFKKDLEAGVDPKVTISEFFVNTTWAGTKNTIFGAEYLWQQTKQTDGFVKKDGSVASSNSDSRLKLFFRYNFF